MLASLIRPLSIVGHLQFYILIHGGGQDSFEWVYDPLLLNLKVHDAGKKGSVVSEIARSSLMHLQVSVN